MIGQQKNNRIPHNQNYHIITEKPVLACSVTSVMSDSMDYSLPLFSVHWLLQARIQWILQTRILQATHSSESVAMCSSRGSSQPRDWSCVSYIPCINMQVLYHFLKSRGISELSWNFWKILPFVLQSSR